MTCIGRYTGEDNTPSVVVVVVVASNFPRQADDVGEIYRMPANETEGDRA